ncbi:MAG: hypothetical protein ACYTXE_41150 [Nostoc sp.]
MVENSVSGVEVKTVHEGETSADPVPNPEKWSHEAIAARSNMRPVRREKLNRAANSGENPGFDFLQECWNDDPAKADCDQEIAGEKVKGCHLRAASCRAGTCSAAPIAQNEFSDKKAIANQIQGLVEQGQSAFLPGENQVSGVEMKANHEGEGSAAPVPSAEKWSHEAIVARSNVRPERIQKLKVAANSGENPGFEFLQECCHDDPAKADCDQEAAGEVSAVGNCLC